MKSLFVRSIALCAVAALASAPAISPAAPSGTAWDSVTKLAMGADPATLQPGSFDDDFAAASSTQMQTPSSGGGFFSHIKQAMQMGQNLGAMMQSGLAERHYVAGSKERTDEVGMQTATITDCVARTITTLNLAKKTYRVESMDQPASASSGGSSSGGGSMPKDDGTRVAISVTNTALGARTVGGQPTRGFSSDMTMTETKPSGESASQHMQMLGYYASFAAPSAQCSRGRAMAGMMAPGQTMAAMAAAARAMRALASAGFDKRFSLKQSGPPLPAANLAMYQAVTFAMQQGRGATFVSERGHVRAIAANDPAFSVPADFTREQ